MGYSKMDEKKEPILVNTNDVEMSIPTDDSENSVRISIKKNPIGFMRLSPVPNINSATMKMSMAFNNPMNAFHKDLPKRISNMRVGEQSMGSNVPFILSYAIVKLEANNVLAHIPNTPPPNTA